MMQKRRAFFAAVVLVISGASAIGLRAAESLRIAPLVRDDTVLVSIELQDAYTDPIREAIASGLRTTFTYELELRTAAPSLYGLFPTWIDRVVARTVVVASDQYDNLTRRHTLTRTIDGRVEEVLVTDDEAVVKSWLTTWTRLPICSTSRLDPTRDYYVRITTRARPIGGSLLGLGRTVTGQAKFTFVP
jgi:hypothetical protein